MWQIHGQSSGGGKEKASRDEEGHFVAEVPELPGCHTQAKSLDALMKRVKEAIGLCLEEKNEKAPRVQLVGVQRIAV